MSPFLNKVKTNWARQNIGAFTAVGARPTWV
eukprot:SAG31_NODE_27799_length_420_cov_0.641745_1_plen_30_part_10